MPTPINLEKCLVNIVDDDVALCQSLQWLLESVGIKSVIFNKSLEFLENFKPDTVSCILLDIRMPDMSGLEIIEQLNQRHNTSPIICITGHGDVPMAVRAMKLSAFDFLTKPFNDQILLEKIQKAIIYNQKTALAKQQSALLNKRFSSLTQREKEILNLIIEGKLNKEIAYLSDISIKTVELHRSNIMKKMQASTIAELVKYYWLVKGIDTQIRV